MEETKISELIQILKTKGEMSFLDLASDEQIESFEKENEVILPEKYKEWLKISDGGEFFLPGGVQLYGVSHKPIIDVTEKDRPDENYIVIGALAMGDPVVFRKNEERISIYNHEADRIEKDETYEDFYSFLNDLCNILGVEE